MKAKKDKSANVQGFRFMFELDQPSLKVFSTGLHMTPRFSLKRLKFNHIRKHENALREEMKPFVDDSMYHQMRQFSEKLIFWVSSPRR